MRLSFIDVYKRQDETGSLLGIANLETLVAQAEASVEPAVRAVSYTHLDVYKRQGWEMAWNFFINAIFRLGILCNSRWRLLILKDCPLRESIIGAAAGGIGHPGLAIGI